MNEDVNLVNTPADDPQVDQDLEDAMPSARQVPTPYSSFKSLDTLVRRLEQHGIPDQFDGTFFGNASGSYISQTRTTLKALGMIDENKRPTRVLRDYVEADERHRKQMLMSLLMEVYPDATALSLTATQGQLAEVFRKRGLGGDTVQKGIAFYLQMAEAAGVPTSKYFKQRISGGSNGSRKTRKRADAPPPSDPSADQQAGPKVTSADGVEAKKLAYIDLLMKMAEGTSSDDGPKPELLDRIERALGMQRETTSGGAPDG